MQAHVFISGFVQGVGFRQFVKKNALALRLKGFVVNLSDSRVEVVAQGLKEDIEKLIKICEKGPFLSEVKSVTVTWEDASEKFEEFFILS